MNPAQPNPPTQARFPDSLWDKPAYPEHKSANNKKAVKETSVNSDTQQKLEQQISQAILKDLKPQA